jgi:hypothetical protein
MFVFLYLNRTWDRLPSISKQQWTSSSLSVLYNTATLAVFSADATFLYLVPRTEAAG